MFGSRSEQSLIKTNDDQLGWISTLPRRAKTNCIRFKIICFVAFGGQVVNCGFLIGYMGVMLPVQSRVAATVLVCCACAADG